VSIYEQQFGRLSPGSDLPGNDPSLPGNRATKPRRPECHACGTFIDEPGLCQECGQAQATTGQGHDSREGGGQWN